jgi:hypothetical protein
MGVSGGFGVGTVKKLLTVCQSVVPAWAPAESGVRKKRQLMSVQMCASQPVAPPAGTFCLNPQ